jgi:hypothetical protein
MSKGSNRRREDLAKIWDNWDAIFKKEPKEQDQAPKEEESKDTPDKKDTK